MAYLCIPIAEGHAARQSTYKRGDNLMRQIDILVAMKLPLQQNFLAIAVPALIAAAAIACVDSRRNASAAAPAEGSLALAVQPE